VSSSTDAGKRDYRHIARPVIRKSTIQGERRGKAVVVSKTSSHKRNLGVYPEHEYYTIQEKEAEMQRKNEGFYADQCQFLMWEVGGGCYRSEYAATKCPECGGEGVIYIGIPLQTPCRAPKCPDCHGTGVGQKPLPGELCHQARPECLSYYPTLMFSCGEGGE